MSLLRLLLCVFNIAIVFSLPPKIIDGLSTDWTSAEVFSGGDGSLWGVSWSNGNFYFSLNSSVITTNQANRWVSFLIDTDPLLTPTSGTGTTSGPTFNTQTPRPSFSANYFVQYQASGAYKALLTYNNAWINTNVSFASAQSTNREFVEIGITLGNLTNPYAVYVCGCIIDETPFGEKAFASFPQSFAGDQYYPNIVWGTYYGFPLYVDQVTPTLRDLTNAEVHRDSFPAQSVTTGSWTSATTWAASVIPTPATPVYITSSATVTNTALISYAKHLIVDTASTLQHTSGTISFTGPTYFANYGNFQSSGTISFAKVGSPTSQTFGNVTISDQTRLGGSTIGTALNLLPGAYLDGAGQQVIYATNSVLRYTTGYSRYIEWDSTSGPGYPFNVRVSSPAVVYLTNSGFSSTVNLSIAGSLTVDFNATVDLSGYQAPFIINGNLLNQGSINLGSNVAADIYVKGTITNSGLVFCSNNNTIFDANNQPFNRPAVTPAGPLVLTTGDSVVLSAPAGNTYVWSTGATTQNITVTTNGNYSVTINDPRNCRATSNFVSVSFVASLTSSPLTSSPLTSGEVSTGSVSTGAVSTGAVTTATINLSTGAITTGVAPQATSGLITTGMSQDTNSATTAAVDNEVTSNMEMTTGDAESSGSIVVFSILIFIVCLLL